MLKELQALASNAAMQRATLLVNHVLTAEPVARERLQRHAGCCIHFQYEQWPTLLPPPPPAAFRVTPAGLLEWCGIEPPQNVQLEVRIDTANPALLVARALSGQRPKVEVSGDAALAADVSWLAENLRWDVQDDLARVIGDGPAQLLGRIGSAFAVALRETVRVGSGLAEKFARRDGPPGAR